MFTISSKLQLAGSHFLSQALRIVTTLVMARFLLPKDYGLFTLVISLPNLVGAMGDFGIPASLVQIRDEDEQSIVDTALVLGIVLYFVYGLLTVAGGIYLYFSHESHDWRFIPISIIVAVSTLLGMVYNIQLATLNRRLHFAAESRQNLIFSIVQAATGIGLAWKGAGVYALAFQIFAAQLVANIAAWRKLPLQWPRLFSMPLAKHYILLGGKVSLALYVTNVQTSIVNIIIEKAAGISVLGMWGRAVQIQQLFAQNLMASVERVVYPLMCDARTDAARLRSIFTKSTITLLLFACFSGAWLWAGSDELIAVMLGKGWEPVGPMLKILAIAVPAGAIYSIGYNACYAMGRTGWLLWISVASLFFYVPLAWLCQRQWGIDGVAWSWVISRYFISLAIFAWVVRLVRPSISSLGGHAVVGVATGLAAAATIFFLGIYLPAGLPLLPKFIAMSVAGAMVYGILIWLTQREFVNFALRMAKGDAK